MYKSNLPSLLLIDTNKDSEAEFTRFVTSDFVVVKASPCDDIISLLNSPLFETKISVLALSNEIALSVLEKIKNSEYKELPVLIITHKASITSEEELLSFEVVDFLKFPFNVFRLRNAVRTCSKLALASKVINELERDDLTGLLTRQAFLHKAQQIRDENPEKSYSVIACDFENFKSSNSLYGEKKCNEFLSHVGKSLLNRFTDGLICRFGGDQFVAFKAYNGSVDVERIEQIKEEILNSAPIPHQTAKVGVYGPIEFELPISICCDRAFLAIHEIKGNYNKNISFYESSLQKQLLDEQRIIETMERGLEDEQFRIFYQPKHESITGNIAGAEALVRWEHPEYGFLSPGQFIPVFEKNGFISKLDIYILTQVCKDIKRWQQNGLPIVPVSVNISRRDFMESGCIEREMQIVDEYCIDHSLLHMEVTESLYSNNTEMIVSQVKKFQDAGFMIEMDDFGSGYSSLGSLSSFPLNILKLDISFVRNINANEIVIENIIKMAHRMGLLTVAEGAESSEQFKTLKSLGCDFIQGFYFSKPLSSKNYESYIKKGLIASVSQIQPSKTSDKDQFITDAMLLAANEVAEGLPGGFFSYHADDNLEIISFNRELLNIYDCETAEEFREFTKNSFKGLVFEDDFERVQQSIQNQITPENDIDYVEYRIKTKRGTIKNVRDYGRFVKTEKYGDIFYVFVNDITEENQKNQAAMKNENANKSKSIFMYNIVKDLFIAMQGIISSTKKIKSNVDDGEKILDFVKDLEFSQEHLLTYLNNLLEFTKLERGEIKVQESPTDISTAAERAYNILLPIAQKRGIKLEYWSEIINPYIYQDVIHTTDVVMNIMHNALKYTPEGGLIRFGIKQLPGSSDDECFVQFVCEDTGIGISEEFMPRIYELFEREDNEINQKNPSSGLGLNISKNLLILMKGSIEISSKKGEGTVVKTIQPHRYADKNDIQNETTLFDNARL